MGAELVFDPVVHRYFLDGKELPSVTTVLKSAGLVDFSMVPAQALEAACERGTFVHELTTLDDLGELDEESVDPELAPYLAGWRKFRKDFPAELLLVEKPLGNAVYGYAGTPDRCLGFATENVLVDIKTGPHSPAHGVQLAAYEKLSEERLKIKFGKLLVVGLTDKGDYSIKDHTPTRKMDWAAFLGALNVHRWKQNNKLA